MVVLALSACSSQDGATSPEEVRKLAGSARAVHARQAAQDRLRDVVQAYAEDTPLGPDMVVMRDTCFGGTAKQWLESNGDDAYKIRCSMRVSAYFGVDPKRIGSVLDGILAAGDRPQSLIAFGHDYYRSHLVGYYRGHGPNPSGPDAPEPTQLFDATQTLSWDPVHDRNPRLLVGEPEQCPKNDPPVTRCLREPESESVAGIRQRHGMVFKLELGSTEYYEVAKDGHVVTG
ncbi:hypothetical protein [Streptomyces barringtoniae]|uniref:hypothetical protein n=1 Tax=Streptomyces barringtoniae TaxID=2892029 RepID=UPI001E4C44B4|nr:hypothetical protein [Streptomyces barringtoniae]MCC5475615.1 hypothetical protein [Streptomyces barringtoniae]